jgi:uncharacterized Zn finger protein (UPF0148 family)
MSSDTAYIKGGCTHCGGHIEFPREAIGAEVACPHCGATTSLLDNLAAPAQASAPAAPSKAGAPALPKSKDVAKQPAPDKPAAFSRECPGCSLEVSIKAEACPSCGAVLREKKGVNLKLIIPVAVLVVAVAGFFAVKSGKLKFPSGGGSPKEETGGAAKPVAPAKKAVKLTGKFEVTEHKIEKTPGTSLMYVVGSVFNGTDKQKFSVRVTFALTDKNGKPAGEATDYITVIESGDTWNFRALILDSAAENAKLTSLDAENP